MVIEIDNPLDRSRSSNIIIHDRESNPNRYLLVGLGGFVHIFWNLPMISSINKAIYRSDNNRDRIFNPYPHIRLYGFVGAVLCVGGVSRKRYNLEYSRSFKDKKMLNEATIERRLITLEQTVGDLQRKIDSKPVTESWLQKLTGSISDEAVFLEALEYGQTFRQSDRPTSESAE
jgi:hypothetical protein